MKTYKVVYLKPDDEASYGQAILEKRHYKRIKALISANDPSEIVSQLSLNSGLVLKVTPITPFTLYLAKANSMQTGGRILQAIAFAVEGGLTPGKALLKVLEEMAENLGLKANAATEILRAGGSFTDAIKSLKIFDSTAIAMLESGEKSGGIRDSINSTIAHIQSSSKAFKALIGAVSWTFIDIMFAVLSIVGLRIQFLPQLATQSKDIKLESQKIEFLKAIDLSIIICDILTVFSAIILIVGFLLMLGFQSGQPEIRRFSAGMIGKIPGLGKSLYHASMASATGVSSRMMRGGVPFITTLDIASRSAQLPNIEKLWQAIKLRLESGISVIDALQSKHFMGTEQLLISTHTTQEQLSSIFETISKAREELSVSASKSFAIFAFVASLLYSGVSVILVLWVVYIQNKYLLQGLEL